MTQKSLLILLSLIIQTVNVYASNDPLNTCNVPDFVNCLSTTKNKCINAFIQSENLCLKEYPLETEFDNDEELYATTRKYVACKMGSFIVLINSNIDKFEQCANHLEPLLSEYERNARKQIKILKEKIRLHEEMNYQ